LWGYGKSILAIVLGVIMKNKIELYAVKIMRMYKNATDESNPWHNIQYKQAMRDSLEQLKRLDLIKDYSLNEYTINNKGV
jgi:hypothetical protein